ncbi:MAG: DUF222 domain-containing protein [Pseudonocardiales bacterium]|nr:DUF222 domain-containing protein [Pseudonocardiales bacterium]
MDVAALSTPELEAELVGLAGHLAAAQCRFLLLLAEFDARGAWAGPGLRSCAHWLSWRVGMDLRTAREQLRVARILPTLPLVTAAFGAGRISYAKARAITRIATPQTEADLLEVALAGTASHLERVVQLARAAGADAAAAVTARRSVTWDWAEDGSLLLRARLPGEQGALFLAVLEAFLEPARQAAEDPDAGQDSAARVEPRIGSAEQPGPEPAWEAAQAELVAAASERAPGAAVDRVAARRADALVALAEAARQRGTAHLSDSVNERCEVVVHVHAESATAEIEGGPALPISTAGRLACQARVSALITDRRDNPLYLGRRRRLVSHHLLRALRARDHGQCRFPGCTNQRVDAHHIVPWLAGGPTDISNLVLVCRFHHTLIHDHGYQIRWVSGDLEFRRPGGAPIPQAAAPTTGTVEHLVEAHTAQQLKITDHSLTPTWSGEAFDPDSILLRLLTEPAQAAAA